MNWAKLSFILLCLVSISCNLKPETPVAKPQKFDAKLYADSLKLERAKTVVKKDSLVKPQSDSLNKKSVPVVAYNETTDTIHVKIVYGKAKIDTVKSPGQRLIFVLNADTANKLNLKITPKDSLANLRITQIQDSKGNSDGPFGKEIQFETKEKGVHQIHISENQMQGNPWGGRFTFEVKLGW